MMNRFTERAQEVMQRAYQIMLSRQHNQLDVEHILLALLEERDGTPGEIIARLGGDVPAMQHRLEAALNALPIVTGPRGTTSYITMRANRVISGAAEEAERLNDEFISTEHLLLAIAYEQSGPSPQILREAGIDLEKIYGILREIRGDRRVTDANTEEASASRGREAREIINPPGLAQPRGFNHGILVTGGRLLFLAGQTATDAEGRVEIAGDLVGQYRQVLSNLKEVVEAVGGEMLDIVKMTIFVGDRDDYRAHLRELGEVHRSFFGAYYPATALFEISRFFEDEVLVEIEGVAVIGTGES